MIEAVASAAGRPVSRETFSRIQSYVDLLRAENTRQNLVSASTVDGIWERHVLDSAQLARFEPASGSSWVDIGSGAGLPGIIIACLVDGPVMLVEPRALRATFLTETVAALGLENTTVVPSKAQGVTDTFDVITGRAVASLPRFLSMCDHLSTRKTCWVLPKGRTAQSELEEAQRSWQGMFHVEQSVTDPEAMIVIGTGVRAVKR